MRIFYIIDALVKGGIERRMLELIKTLSKDKQFEIYLITLNDTVEYEYVYDLPIKFEVIKRKVKKDLSLYFKLYKKIKEFKPDIIHSWGSMSSLLAAPIAKLLRVRFVNGYIGQAPLKVTFSDVMYTRGLLTFPISDAVVSNSQAGLKAYKAPEKKSYCIYNGIDFNRFNNLKPIAEVKNEVLGDKNDQCFVVAMVAAFEDRKDYQTFVNVAIKMCDLVGPIKFLAIGGGKKLDEIRNMVPEKYLNTKIFLLGKRPDVESIMQIIDIGILLTNSNVHGEGISNSIIEYMASGKPVIATRGGGTDEVVFDDDNGFLVDFASEKQIMDKIFYLKDNKDQAVRLGTNGYNLVHKTFDVTAMTDNYIKLYTKLLAS